MDQTVSELVQKIVSNPEAFSSEELSVVAQIVREHTGIKLNDWITRYSLPTVKQELFLSLDCKEAAYGGAAGGGKSVALWMSALQYVDIPGYSAIIFRRNRTELTLPSGLIPLSRTWLSGTKARYNSIDYTWRFPSGAVIIFGYLDNEKDKFRYHSSEFQFIGFDETTQFTESLYTYLFSRLRRTNKLKCVPLRVRGATNPGGEGHEWFAKRFFGSTIDKVDFKKEVIWNDGRAFVPARMDDNKHLDKESYKDSLSNLIHEDRERLEKGDWTLVQSGGIFKHEWFRMYMVQGDYALHRGERVPLHMATKFATADTATMEKTSADYTVFCSWFIWQGRLILKNVLREKMEVPKLSPTLKKFLRDEGCQYVVIENKSSGIGLIQEFKNEGIAVRPFNPGNTDKISRATTARILAGEGRIWVPAAKGFTSSFLNEVVQFPITEYDDQVDNLSMAALDIHGSGTGGGSLPQPLGSGPSSLGMSTARRGSLNG